MGAETHSQPFYAQTSRRTHSELCLKMGADMQLLSFTVFSLHNSYQTVNTCYIDDSGVPLPESVNSNWTCPACCCCLSASSSHDNSDFTSLFCLSAEWGVSSDRWARRWEPKGLLWNQQTSQIESLSHRLICLHQSPLPWSRFAWELEEQERRSECSCFLCLLSAHCRADAGLCQTVKTLFLLTHHSFVTSGL